jgi:predicted transcriptional regulator
MAGVGCFWYNGDMTDIEWAEIRFQYEAGISQRTLATKYGVSQATISRRAGKENWCITERITPVSLIRSDAQDKKTDVLIVADTLLDKVAEQAETVDDPRDIKNLADTLSQIHKIKLTSHSSDKPTASGIPAELLPYATLDELAQLDSIVKAIEERKLQAEQEAAGVRPLRKHS